MHSLEALVCVDGATRPVQQSPLTSAFVYKHRVTFPPHLPADCPLPSAVECDATVFMLSRQVPLAPDDCLSQAERGRANHVQGAGACTRHGLSVFKNLADCLHLRSVFPQLGPHVVQATLRRDHGVLAETPSKTSNGHCTWWPFVEVERHALFSEAPHVG
jgi:hypothetical protein